MIKIKLVVALAIITNTVFSQNLVKNPSFEEIGQNSTQWSSRSLLSVNFWCTRYCGGVDNQWEGRLCHSFHFHKNLKDDGYRPAGEFHKLAQKHGYKAPNNFLGFQYARTGDGYLAFGSIIHPRVEKELISSNSAVYGEFTDPLKKNTLYQIEFYISLSDRYVISPDSFYIAFRDSQFTEDKYIKTVKRQIEISVENTKFDTESWSKVSANYLAKGNERYIAIGTGPKVSEIKNKDFFFVFIDDVSVKEVKDTLIFEADKPLILKKIVFATGSANLLPQSIPELEKLQNYLLMHPKIKLEISGHTDSEGIADDNMKLSQARAESVREYLIDKGIKANRLTAKGYGETVPILSNTSEEGKAQNRRVEVKIIK